MISHLRGRDRVIGATAVLALLALVALVLVPWLRGQQVGASAPGPWATGTPDADSPSRTTSPTRWPTPTPAATVTRSVREAAGSEPLERITPRAGNRLECDFDGDGYDDFAVGNELADVGGVAYAGSLSIVYGSSTGLSPEGDQLVHRDLPGVPGEPDDNDGFGRNWVCANVNGDEFADLVVGSYYDPAVVDGRVHELAGSVYVFHGTRDGLSVGWDEDPCTRTQYLRRTTTRDGNRIPGRTMTREFGGSLEAGDFDDDGIDDLLINEVVLPGAPCGLLDREPWRFFDSTGSFDGGYVVGDLNGDGYDDVVSVIRREEFVRVSLGGPDGLAQERELTREFGADFEPVPYSIEDWWLALFDVDDFDGDGYDDVAVQTPRPDYEDERAVVHVFYGDADAELDRQRRWLVPDELDEAMLHVQPLATGDLPSGRLGDYDGDGALDLATLDEPDYGVSWLVTYLGEPGRLSTDRLTRWPLSPPWIKGWAHGVLPGYPDEPWSGH